jgi:hypothetical protein
LLDEKVKCLTVPETFAKRRALRDAVNPKGSKPFAPVSRFERGF